MAREILFRGKVRTTGSWVTGWYCGQTNQSFFGEPVNRPQIIVKDDLGWAEVDPETVGQYTGLKDKNGKMVFEGDILKAYYDDEDPETATLSVVEWEQNGWRLKQIGCPAYDDLDDFAIKLNAVVGNIHDNPELLCDKGKEKE